jgi:outer membrane receptor protein involved in Fe transport
MKTLRIYSLLTIICVITYVNKAFSQEKVARYNINGKLASEQNTRVAEVAIQLLQASDKKLVKIEYPDEQGNFLFEKIPTGTYILVTQSMSFITYQSSPIVLNKNTDAGTILLKPTSTTLKETNIVAIKPLIQQQYDKTVLNVAGSISAAGSTALEVLAKAPGITIDQNDNIAMRGRQGVLVMIDGKQVPMSGQDLANMLRNMSATQIDKIDLITNPSAKYDAAGNAGIIDIRLRKGMSAGTNGNVSLSYGQGAYPKFTPSLNFNSKHKKVNVFGSYSYGYWEDYNDLTIYRKFYDPNNQVTGGNDYDNFFKYLSKSHNARVGVDYNIKPNIVVGIVANGNFAGIDISSNSAAQSFDAQQQKAGTFTTTGDNHPTRNNGSINLNYKHTIDTTGKELTADLDYARYNSGEIQHYKTLYFDNEHLPSKPLFLLLGDLNGDLNIKSFKIDYTHPLKSIGVKLETGIKSSWVKSDNNVKFFDQSTGQDILDEGKSNHFIYEENINAAYLNASKKWKQLSIQLGMRLENTNANGIQVTSKDNFDRKYTQFFPSGYIGYTFNSNNDLGLSLSRRINRPSYRQLNPFKIFLDPLTSSAGNPYLNPELTNSFELTHTFKQQYTTKIGYSRTTDNILMVLSPDVQPNSVLQTSRNLAKYDYYSFSFGFPVAIGKWLNSTNNALLYYGKYQGHLVNTDLDASRVSFNFNSSNTINLNPVTTMEVVGNYQSRSYYGFFDEGSYWSVNIGGQRQLWDKKASIKLNLSDVFFTNQTRATTKLTGYGERFIQNRDTRVLTLTFSYKFGKSSSNGAKRNTGGAEEEKGRAG